MSEPVPDALQIMLPDVRTGVYSGAASGHGIGGNASLHGDGAFVGTASGALVCVGTLVSFGALIGAGTSGGHGTAGMAAGGTSGVTLLD